MSRRKSWQDWFVDRVERKHDIVKRPWQFGFRITDEGEVPLGLTGKRKGVCRNEPSCP